MGINYESVRQRDTKSKIQFKSSASTSYSLAVFKLGFVVPEQFNLGVVSYSRLLSTQTAKHNYSIILIQ